MCNLVVFLKRIIYVLVHDHLDNEAYYKYMHTQFVLRQLLIFFFLI